MQNSDDHIHQRKPIAFKQFKDYCQKIVPIFNLPQISQKQNTIHESGKHILSYTASYKIINLKFAKQHDCEYMEIQQLSFNGTQKVLLKINIIYSISYQIPLLLFMPYHLEEDQADIELKPFRNEQMSQVINPTIGSQKMNPAEEQTGVFIIQNPINKEYFYTLHHCYMDTQQMTINQIIPYYLAIIGCHPQIVL